MRWAAWGPGRERVASGQKRGLSQPQGPDISAAELHAARARARRGPETSLAPCLGQRQALAAGGADPGRRGRHSDRRYRAGGYRVGHPERAVVQGSGRGSRPASADMAPHPGSSRITGVSPPSCTEGPLQSSTKARSGECVPTEPWREGQRTAAQRGNSVSEALRSLSLGVLVCEMGGRRSEEGKPHERCRARPGQQRPLQAGGQRRPCRPSRE